MGPGARHPRNEVVALRDALSNAERGSAATPLPALHQTKHHQSTRHSCRSQPIQFPYTYSLIDNSQPATSPSFNAHPTHPALRVPLLNHTMHAVSPCHIFIPFRPLIRPKKIALPDSAQHGSVHVHVAVPTRVGYIPNHTRNKTTRERGCRTPLVDGLTEKSSDFF